MVASIGSAGTSGMATQMAQMRQQIFKKSDADSSGGLDVEEFKTMVANGPGRPGNSSSSVEQDFASFDSDGDGSLTQDELDTGIENKMAEFRSTVDRFGGPPPGRPPGCGGGDDDSEDDEDDPLQALLTALQSDDAKSQQVASQLRQLLQGLMDDGESTTGSSSLAVTA